MFGWYIQIGAYSQKANAEKVKDLLEQAGFKGVWVYSTEASGGTKELHKVHIGPYDDEHIQQAMNTIRTVWINLNTR